MGSLPQDMVSCRVCTVLRTIAHRNVLWKQTIFKFLCPLSKRSDCWVFSSRLLWHFCLLFHNSFGDWYLFSCPSLHWVVIHFSCRCVDCYALVHGPLFKLTSSRPSCPVRSLPLSALKVILLIPDPGRVMCVSPQPWLPFLPHTGGPCAPDLLRKTCSLPEFSPDIKCLNDRQISSGCDWCPRGRTKRATFPDFPFGCMIVRYCPPKTYHT